MLVPSGMAPALSIPIICRNNILTIERTLASAGRLIEALGGDGEIVAADSGSTDGTLALLERSGARVIATPWLGFVRTRTVALEACAGEWMLWLDSDECLEDDAVAAAAGAIRAATPTDAGYWMNCRTWYAGAPLRHAWQPEWRLRMVRRRLARWVPPEPHERLEVMPDPAERARAVRRLPGTVRHDSFVSIADHFGKQLTYAKAAAESMARAGRRSSALRLVASPAWALVKHAILKRGFQDGWRGWVAAASTAAGSLMKHAILLEKGRGGEASKPEGARI